MMGVVAATCHWQWERVKKIDSKAHKAQNLEENKQSFAVAFKLRFGSRRVKSRSGHVKRIKLTASKQLNLFVRKGSCHCILLMIVK
jgi:hypothetical protein